MKRHSALISFSKQHHHMLVLAQVLKADVPDYKGMPTTLEAKIDFLLNKFDEIILPNFNIHRKVFYPAILQWGFPDEGMIEHIQEQEDDILKTVQAIKQGSNPSEIQINDFGYALDTLVRTKERELYEMVQVRFNEELTELKF